MEGYDLVTDSYSMELLIGLVLERVWSRVQNYLHERDKEKEKREKADQDARQNEMLAEIKANQEIFREYIGNKLK